MAFPKRSALKIINIIIVAVVAIGMVLYLFIPLL